MFVQVRDEEDFQRNAVNMIHETAAYFDSLNANSPQYTNQILFEPFQVNKSVFYLDPTTVYSHALPGNNWYACEIVASIPGNCITSVAFCCNPHHHHQTSMTHGLEFITKVSRQGSHKPRKWPPYPDLIFCWALMTLFFWSIILKLALLHKMKHTVGCLMKFTLNWVGFPGHASGPLSFALFVHISCRSRSWELPELCGIFCQSAVIKRMQLVE